MEYKYIVNPMTNRRVKADSVLGKRLNQKLRWRWRKNKKGY